MSGPVMRLVFMGTPEFAVPTLRALVETGHAVIAAYCQPPRPAGRGKKPRKSPVHAAAEALGIEARTPPRLRDPDALEALQALKADAAVVVAYGQILPRGALDAARLGAFNLHASLLPRWRGAAPIHRAVMAGDAETGVCVMRMTEGLDEGPVIASARTPIGATETTGALHDRLAALGAPLMVAALEDVAAGRATETPQPEEGAVYAAKIDKAEARIAWSRPALELDRLIRGLSPAPGAWCEAAPEAGGPLERVKVLDAALERIDAAGPAFAEAPPGAALDDSLLIKCGDAPESGAALRLKLVQRPGKSPVEAADFLRGFPLKEGGRLT